MVDLSGLSTPRRGLLLAAGTLAAAPSLRQARAAGSLGRLTEGAPKPLPDFIFTDAEGAEHRVADFPGQGLLINLWATWCVPCVAEMPSLDRAQAVLKQEGILVLALSSDRGGRSAVEPFYRERKIERLGLWLDPKGAAGRALGVRGLPTTVVVDREGRERARLEGEAAWDTAPMLDAVRRLIGPASAPPDQTKT
ncbi:TlpA family protein disulfide reductase [Paracraurococcus lichenis]|uniref:TlpA disulfide reductase family protein n=1 Tax=Paracraurococcus lichenis TaxID=3064888 RepID=A0ABT9DW86_9PROT|nr:TlpA disulfide reductase family protein [Paracraurococcus sp. LOR1-02]MDO9708060.1 TlpA disulfide reductase family protein [Paracraurococcus sp. LOR1-02]